MDVFKKPNNPNLILVDFACHGVPSPKVWKKYLAWLQSKNDSSLKSYRFRDKKFGYQYTTFSAKYEDGTDYVISDCNNDRDFMKDSFLEMLFQGRLAITANLNRSNMSVMLRCSIAGIMKN